MVDNYRNQIQVISTSRDGKIFLSSWGCAAVCTEWMSGWARERMDAALERMRKWKTITDHGWHGNLKTGFVGFACSWWGESEGTPTRFSIGSDKRMYRHLGSTTLTRQLCHCRPVHFQSTYLVVDINLKWAYGLSYSTEVCKVTV